ncbi:MAG: sugar O-acetyltransferase [Weeksellaceae bacterium]|nr:sugar O-acetyltransferase [Weeksellaceae bacterium]
MTEKEKCKEGLLYDANDFELVSERNLCKQLCQQYNQSQYSEVEKRKEIIQKIIPSAKANSVIEPSFWCDYGYNIHIGDHFYSNHNLVILDAAQVKFGNNVFIGPNCAFYTAGHPENIPQRNAGLEYAKAIIIGSNIWFGGNVVVLPGVTIGDNSIIGAGSIVTKDIPQNVVAVGKPCKVIREIST